MGSIEQFQQIKRTGKVTGNLDVLGLPGDEKRLCILWMYPDILSLHGGRGDIMALLRFATAAGLPVEIRRVEQPADPIPLEQADMLWFCCGDLTGMPDLIRALEPKKEALQAFAGAGKVLVANGSSGAIFARQLTLLDGQSVAGLGLLGMNWTERSSVHGDDLWLDAMDGIEVIGNEIKLADVTLEPGQAPFGKVHYGRGNCGDGYEGAKTGNVIYTACLGPVLVRNPALAMALLRRGAEAAGMTIDARRFVPDNGDIAMENQGLADARRFITQKMNAKK